VSSQADRGVSQHLLDDARMHALAQEQRRARMPEVVEPDRRESRFLEQGLEGAVDDVPGVQRRASHRGEHEPFVLVELAGLRHLVRLPRTVAPHGCQGRGAQPGTVRCPLAVLGLRTRVPSRRASSGADGRPVAAWAQFHPGPRPSTSAPGARRALSPWRRPRCTAPGSDTHVSPLGTCESPRVRGRQPPRPPAGDVHGLRHIAGHDSRRRIKPAWSPGSYGRAQGGSRRCRIATDRDEA
jgi:hypothetical protein